MSGRGPSVVVHSAVRARGVDLFAPSWLAPSWLAPSWLAPSWRVPSWSVLSCLLVLSGLGFSSCGYSTAKAESMPSGYRKIYVAEAIDLAFDVGTASALTRYFRQWVQASRVAEHTSAQEAELVAELRVENSVDTPSVSGATPPGAQVVAVPKFSLQLVGSLRLFDASRALVWQSGSVTVGEDYLAGANQTVLAVTEENRRRALARAAVRLARELYGRMVEGF